MTLEEARRAGIEHENFQIRSVMLRILANECRPGEGVAMAAIRQIKKHGWRGAFEFPYHVAELPHTEESLDWVCDWLEASTSRRGEDLQQAHLARWFCEAPVEWLGPRIDRFVEPVVAALTSDTKTTRSEPVVFTSPEVGFDRAVNRLVAASWSEDECRAGLEEVLALCAGTLEFPHEAIKRLEVVCEALAARGLLSEEATGVWLDLADLNPEREVGVDDYRAGAALMILRFGRLQPPVEKIVRLLSFDWDWIDELVKDALVAGGGRETLETLIHLFPDCDWAAKLYLSSAIERLRFDGLEDEVIRLLRAEQDDDIRVRLARGLALYGTERAIKVAHEIAAEHPDDPERVELLNILHAQDVVSGVDNDETRRHLRVMERDCRERQAGIARFEGLMSRLSPGAGTGGSRAKIHKIETPRPPSRPAPPKPPVSRNEPCPCGSGKKFKKCCG